MGFLCLLAASALAMVVTAQKTRPVCPTFQCDATFIRGHEPDLGLSPSPTAFDSYNIMSPFVAQVGSTWRMFYGGGPISGMPGYLRYQIGGATATASGGPWTRDGDPLIPLGVVDDFHTTPTLLRGEGNVVLKEGGLYHMLFCGNRNDSVYHATSPDGVVWTKNTTSIYTGYAPNVLRINGTLWLFSIAKPATKPWEVTVAHGTTWDNLRHVGTVLQSNTQPWEQGDMFYPYAVYEGATAGWTMAWSAYSNKSVVKTAWGGQVTAIGLAHSPNGLNWTKCSSNPILTPRAGSTFDSVYVGSPCLLTTVPPMLYYGSRIDQSHKYFALAHATMGNTSTSNGS